MRRRRGATGGLMNVILGMGRIEFYTTERAGGIFRQGRAQAGFFSSKAMYFWIKLVTTLNRSPPSAGRST